MTMPCRNTAALARFERHDVDAERRYEMNLATFQSAPYDAIEWEAQKACPYMLAALALELMGREFGVDYKAPESTKEEFRRWMNEVIAGLDP